MPCAGGVVRAVEGVMEEVSGKEEKEGVQQGGRGGGMEGRWGYLAIASEGRWSSEPMTAAGPRR